MSSKPLSFLRSRIWGHASHPHTWPLDAKTATGFLLCLGLFTLVGWLYLTQASQMAATGYHMQEIVISIEKLERENALLRYQIAELETLPRIEARARQIGMGPMTRTTYLVFPAYPVMPEVLPIDAKAMPSPHEVDAAEITGSAPWAGLLKVWSGLKAEFEAWVGKS